MKEQFLIELKQLLTKYSGEIYAVSEGEGYSIHNEAMEISIHEAGKEILVKCIPGRGVSASDL